MVTTSVAKRTIAISEVFGITVQGEGALIGRPTIFVRTGGCDYQHCAWCDTLYAVLPEHKSQWHAMTTDQVFAEVQRLSGDKPILVTLSGGNPAIQPLEDLIDLGHQHGYTFAIETQGSIAQPWFAKLDHLTLSPKPPSSKMKTNWHRLDKCLDIVRLQQHCSTVLKVVVFDDADYAYAQEVHSRYPSIQMYLQVGNEMVGNVDLMKGLQKLEWLINKVTTDRWNSVVVLPQLHVLIWQNRRGK